MKSETINRAQAAVRSSAQESFSLDYKLAPYDYTEGGRKEFAKDISAFANQAGGLLILGVREENGIPAEIVGIAADATDQCVLWLESVARSAVAPHIVGLTIVPFMLNDRQLIAVEVPKGGDPPYEVSTAGARFFVREERSVRTMSRDEIRLAVRRDADLAERITDFCDQRWREFTGGSADPRKKLGALLRWLPANSLPVF